MVPLYGVIGGLSCCVLLLIAICIIFVLVACYYHRVPQGTGHTYNLMSSFKLSNYVVEDENIEMTQNLVYGKNTHIVSGVTHPNSTPDDPQDDPDYNYISYSNDDCTN